MKLLVIEPYVAQRSPTMRAWVMAFPHFQDLFENIEIWASECDIPTSERVSWTQLKQRIPLTGPHLLDFQWRASRKLAAHHPTEDTIIFTSGCNVPIADIRYMQFWNRAMLEEQAKRPQTFQLKWHQRFLASVVARTEIEVTGTERATKWWWVVSRSLAERIRADGPGGEFRVLANQYDPERFNRKVAEEWREPMRMSYGIQKDEKIFAFSSFGQFERKGLLQAVEAVDILRKRGHQCRMLVLGGSPRTLENFKKSMAARSIDPDCCIFAGLVDHIERHLVAGDGFLFPTHFEAFSLAEIEAAALGLRLYLTDHYGSEMILRDPSNGRLLPWDPKGMADVLEDDLQQGRIGTPHSETGEALTVDEFAVRIRGLFEEAIASKRRQTGFETSMS